MFTSENAVSIGRKGGTNSHGSGFKQKADQWIREHGAQKAFDWVNGKDGDEEVPWPQRQFAMGLLFSYALGRPTENIRIDDRKEIYINLSKDPALNELAKRFGIHSGTILEAGNGIVADGTTPVQVEGPPIHRI